MGELDVYAVDPKDIPADDPVPFLRYGRGTIVALSRIPGLTKPPILQRPFYFQCPPTDSIGPTLSWSWNDYATLGVGMHSNPAYRTLATITISSLVVDTGEVYEARGPGSRFSRWAAGPHFAITDLEQDLISTMQRLRVVGDGMTPFALQWGQPALWGHWDYLHAVTLREFHPEERAGEMDARYFTLSVTEYPDAPRLRAVPPPLPPGQGHRGGQVPGVIAVLNSATLPAGKRTLAGLAKAYYRAPSKWRLIGKASHLLRYGIGSNTNLRNHKKIGRARPPRKIIIPKLPQGD
jgi:hypothetical protein